MLEHPQQIWGRHKTGSSVGYTRGLCWHPEVVSRLEKMGWQEPLQVPEEVWSPTSQEEQFHPYMLVALQRESSMAKEDCRALVVTKVVTVQQGVLAARRKIYLWAALGGVLSAFHGKGSLPFSHKHQSCITYPPHSLAKADQDLGFSHLKSSIHGFTPF